MFDKKQEEFFVETFKDVKRLLQSIDSRLQGIDESLSSIPHIENKLDSIENRIDDIADNLPKRKLGEDEIAQRHENIVQQCIEVIRSEPRSEPRSEQKVSVWFLKRRLRLEHTRATQIMDELERRGIVGAEGTDGLREIKDATL